MIKFFRNIRRQLLGVGKTGKYFKYAIGEILLVMIGILLALQVNNWNESRKSYNNEIKLVKQLLEDAKADSVFFKSRIMHQQIRDTLYNNLILANKGLASDSLLRTEVHDDPFFFRLAYQSNLINNNPEAYDLISNDSIKTMLRTYKARYDYVVHSIELNNRLSEEYGVPMQIKYFENIRKLQEQPLLVDLNFTYNDSESTAIFSMLKTYGVNYYIQVDRFLEKNQQLIVLIESYLTGNH